jgi:hypothetical protein
MLALTLMMKMISVHSILNHENIIIAINIDMEVNKYVYEGLRLLKSLQLFGGNLKYSRLFVCLATNEYHNSNKSERFQLILSLLKEFNITYLQYHERFSMPNFSPSLNKLCCLNISHYHFHDDDYLLYLDSDIFISKDPLPLLNYYITQSRYDYEEYDIYCGRPWNTFPNLHLFHEFVGYHDPHMNISYNDYYSFIYNQSNLLDTISIHGKTLYGMCNTGMYLIRIKVMASYYNTIMTYFNRVNSSWFTYDSNAIDTYSYTYFGIDSILMWAAQHALYLKIRIVSPLLNYIAAAENYLLRFIHPNEFDLILFDPMENTYQLERMIYENYLADDASINETVIAALIPHLIHFSKGSSLTFNLSNDSNHIYATEGHNNNTMTQCGIVLKCQCNSVSMLKATISSLILQNNSNCYEFYRLLHHFV